jgi:tetratricopeptide (TPR) repeat protein
MQELDHVFDLLRNRQQESSLSLLDRLINDASQPECFRVYAGTVRTQALEYFGKPEESLASAKELPRMFPNSGFAHESLGDVYFQDEEFAEAMDHFAEALAHFPAEATEPMTRTLVKLGTCHNYQGRPIAGWACWRQALLVDPKSTLAQEALDEFVHKNRFLPHQAQQGLTLKNADEFTLFNEELADRWEKANLAGERLHVDELVSNFEYLVGQDASNASAWYNLGLSCAWSGANMRAIDALAKYVAREEDVDAAADAWDLAEILRMGGGAEEVSDNLLHVALYRVVDPQAFLERLSTVKNLVVVSSGEENRSLHWMDKEVTPNEGVPILGGPPRQIAQLVFFGPVLEVVATSQANLHDVRSKLEPTADQTLQWETTLTRAGHPMSLDAEPFLVMGDVNEGTLTEEAKLAKTTESVRRYFEEIWLRRPLRSLGGLSPIDVGQNPEFRKRLEGVIRFRERIFEARGSGYNFDRLRHKLGLPIRGSGLADHADPTSASGDVDVSVYSAAQLAALDPAKLDDMVLVQAYRAAIHLDVPQTANRLAEHLAQRESVSQLIDMNGVFRRLIQDAQRSKSGDVGELIARARAYDARHYAQREAAMLDYWEARHQLQTGPKGDAVKALCSLSEKHPDRLDVAASAVESLLSAGEYGVARDLAEKGLVKAERDRNADYQSRFRDYVREAGNRQ